MKKLAIVLVGIFLISFTAKATLVASEDYTVNRYDGKAYIFVEGGVEFSVFPDGQFDFAYVGQANGTEVTINSPNVNVSFNSGQDYDMYVQYDDYGAVIQVENVAVFYDGYGRISQAGSVDIQYNNRRIVRVGGLFINYDYYGYYAGCTGFINVYNRFYVYRPWHVFYVRPLFASCIVYDYPYRRYYSPVRYSFYHHRNYYNNRHRVAYANGRRGFHRPGSRIHYRGGRTAVNRDFNPNRRNTMISKSGRQNNAANSRGIAQTNDRGTARNGNKTATTRGIAKNSNGNRTTTSRGVAKKDTRGIAKSSNGNRTTTSRGIAKKDNRGTARTSNKSTSNRSVAKNSGSRKVAKTTRPQQKRSTVARSSSNKNIKRSATTRAPKTATAKRSTNTRSKSVTRSGSTKSRGNTTRKGRGN